IPAQVRRLPVWAEHVGDCIQPRADLGLAVALLLYRLGIEAEGDVVDEHAAVDLSQVDAPRAAVDERVQGADYIVAVYAEVKREVVARPGRDAGVGQARVRGDHCHNGLGSVSPGHREPIGATPYGCANELLEVVTPAQRDRLDP